MRVNLDISIEQIANIINNMDIEDKEKLEKLTSIKQKYNNKKNILQLVNKIKENNIFKDIKDPKEWQNNIR